MVSVNAFPVRRSTVARLSLFVKILFLGDNFVETSILGNILSKPYKKVAESQIYDANAEKNNFVCHLIIA